MASRSLPPVDLSSPQAWAENHEKTSLELDCIAFALPDIARIELRLDLASGTVLANILPARLLRLASMEIPLRFQSAAEAASSFSIARPEIARQASIAGKLLFELGYCDMPSEKLAPWPNAVFPNPTLGLGCSLIWDARHSDGADRDDPSSGEDMFANLLALADRAPEQARDCAMAGISLLSGIGQEAMREALAELEAQEIAPSPVLSPVQATTLASLPPAQKIRL
jgi:hypothetical protein